MAQSAALLVPQDAYYYHHYAEMDATAVMHHQPFLSLYTAILRVQLDPLVGRGIHHRAELYMNI
jgi:hypothetical protein